MPRVMDWQKLSAAAPVNKAAALAVGRTNEQQPTGSPFPRFRIDELPAIIPFRTSYRIRNLAGSEAGRFRVIGYIGPLGTGKHAKPLWLVRCVCGTYEGRRYETIKKMRPDAMCWDCHHVDRMRRALRIAQGTPTRSAETTGSVGAADGGPVANGDAPEPSREPSPHNPSGEMT